MPTLIQKMTGVTLGDVTLPKRSRDTQINAGTLFMRDFANGFCYDPAIVTPPNGKVVPDLVRGAASSTIVQAAGFEATHNGKGLLLPDLVSGAPKSYVTRPGRNYGDGHAYLWASWMRYRTTANTGTNGTQGIFSQSNNYASTDPDNVVSILTSSGGIYAVVFGAPSVAGSPLLASAGSVTTAIGGGGLVDGALIQVGVALTLQGGTGSNYKLAIYANGTLCNLSNLAINTLNPSAVLPAVTGAISPLFYPSKSRFYRTWVEDLTTSTRTPAAALAADYTANVGRFS